MSLNKNINPSLVLDQPRKTRPFITERLLMGHRESNQTKKKSEALHCVLEQDTLSSAFKVLVQPRKIVPTMADMTEKLLTGT